VRNSRTTLALVAAFLLTLVPLPSRAQLYVNIGAPPLLPAFYQPQLTVPNDVWMPGYWAWGNYGYYWVPGTWVASPQPGLNWTPGYWGYQSNGYQWNQGYWAPQVGYYGGVNYGGGYYGNGFVGGAWQGNNFRYNTAVMSVNPAYVRNVYVNRTVIVRNITRISYNGGRGLTVRPTPAQIIIARGRRFGLTAAQRNHIVVAGGDRTLLAKVNGGSPPVRGVAHPFTTSNRPSSFKPVTAADRVDAKPVSAPKPAFHPAPVTHPAPAYHPAPVTHPAPAYHAPAPQVHHAQPPVHQAPVHPAHPAPQHPAHPAPQHPAQPPHNNNAPPKPEEKPH
jgi:WXXGXW repeat (2 copies)